MITESLTENRSKSRCQFDFAKLAAQTSSFLGALASDRKKELSPELALSLKTAYEKGGLDAVDQLCESINRKLLESGKSCGFGPGSAFVNAADFSRLYVFFAHFDSDQIIARRFVDVRPGS